MNGVGPRRKRDATLLSRMETGEVPCMAPRFTR
jgi:hypothetical protein